MSIFNSGYSPGQGVFLTVRPGRIFSIRIIMFYHGIDKQNMKQGSAPAPAKHRPSFVDKPQGVFYSIYLGML